MGISGSEGRGSPARAYVERLEAALAAANHERDLAEERARLAGEGVQHLEGRLERLRREGEHSRGECERLEADLATTRRVLENAQAGIESRDRRLEVADERLRAREGELKETGDALERERVELAEVRAWLETRERHLRNAQLGVEARDRRLEVAGDKLEAADQTLGSREAELRRLRATVREHERKQALTEAQSERVRRRAEFFQGSLVELRSGRAYRLMRILWRLRHPFRRSPRRGPAPSADTVGAGAASEGSEPVPQAAASVKVAERRRPPPGGEALRVASILDEMSAACFAPECELVPLTLDRWAEQLDADPPHLLLVESAWQGNGGEWQYRIAQYPRKDLVGLPALRGLVDSCRERGVPTVFWNKEDPVHFDRFVEAASLFDHVFTTDARCVERYSALPGRRERTVTPLPFAAQPRIHNPVTVVPERGSSPCFAGAWYRDRHEERRRALEALLDAARPYGLVIYDRRFGADDDAFGFPDRFAPHVLGRLPYERVLDVYKSHRVFLNANSVADSPTMCSRRVFELAACDTAILSTPGAAMSVLLGEGVVGEAADEQAAGDELERLLGDEDERRRRTRAARRAVFAAHTYRDRLVTIADVAGLDVAVHLRRDPFPQPGPAANGGGGGSHPWELQLRPGVALGEAALADLAAAATFATADAIGVGVSNGAPAVEHRHVSELDPRALLLRRELIEDRGIPGGSPEEIRAQLRSWSDEGVSLYAADRDLLTAA